MINLAKQNKKLLTTIKALIKKRGISSKVFLSYNQDAKATDSDLFLKMNFYDNIDLSTKDNIINPTTKVSDIGISTNIMFVAENTSNEEYFYEQDTRFNTNPNPYCFIGYDNEKIEVGSIITIPYGVNYEVVEKIKLAGLTDVVKFKLSIK